MRKIRGLPVHCRQVRVSGPGRPTWGECDRVRLTRVPAPPEDESPPWGVRHSIPSLPARRTPSHPRHSNWTQTLSLLLAERVTSVGRYPRRKDRPRFAGLKNLSSFSLGTRPSRRPSARRVTSPSRPCRRLPREPSSDAGRLQRTTPEPPRARSPSPCLPIAVF